MSSERAITVQGGVDAGGSPVVVNVKDGVIVETAPAHATVIDAHGCTVAPGLIDLQVNGAVGIDITATPERLWDVAAALPRFGVTAFTPTVITSAPQARAQAIATLAAGPEAGWSGAVPLGLHFEGPMLAPTRKGAHPERWLRPPALDLVDGWSPEAGVLIATLAPELPGALEIVRALAERGVVVSVGHTDADARSVQAAVTAGARMLTHLGNAMPPMQSRAPGPVGVALGGSELIAGVIADGLHLDAEVIRTAWRCLGPSRFLSVTDTTAALGVPDGPYRLGDQPVIVSDGAVRLHDGTLAGSAASLPQCLRVLRAASGCSLAEALATCTSVPAAVIGDPLRGTLALGARADLTLLSDSLEVAATIVGGNLLFDGRVSGARRASVG